MLLSDVLKFLHLCWFILYFPLILLYRLLFKFSIFCQKRIIEKYQTPIIPAIKKFHKLDLYIFQQFDELLKNHKEWVLYPFDKKTKRQYMKAIDTKKVIDFVSKTEKKKVGSEMVPNKDATIFKVKMVSTTQQAMIRDNLYKVSGTGKQRSEKFQAGTMNLDTLKNGLAGWENFKDDKGMEIAFDERNKEDMINMIPAAVAEEIANFVRGESELDEGEG
jgi:hypothetical protein